LRVILAPHRKTVSQTVLPKFLLHYAYKNLSTCLPFLQKRYTFRINAQGLATVSQTVSLAGSLL